MACLKKLSSDITLDCTSNLHFLGGTGEIDEIGRASCRERV